MILNDLGGCMIPINRKPFTFHGKDGELQYGVSSLNKGEYVNVDTIMKSVDMSVKFAYKDNIGRISRSCPEVSIPVFLEMFSFLLENNAFTLEQKRYLVKVWDDNKRKS
jgi:hypothetical protein